MAGDIPSGSLLLLAIAAVLFIFILYRTATSKRREAKRLTQHHAFVQHFKSLLAERQFLQVIEDLAPVTWPDPELLTMRAEAQLSLWRAEAALRTFDQVDFILLAPLANFTEAERTGHYSMKALAAALFGKIESAAGMTSTLDHTEPLVLLVWAIIAIRQEEWIDGERLLRRDELVKFPEGGMNSGLVAALLAWCLQKNHGQSVPVNRVAVFGEAGIDAVCEVWPEFLEFVLSAPEV